MATRKSTTKRSTTKKRTTKNTKKQNSISNGLTDEILLLSVLAISIILLLSDFGVGGILGEKVAGLFFGLFGFLSFIFPFVLFLSTAFFIANKDNFLVKKRIIIAIISYVLLCALTHLIMVDIDYSSKILECFVYSATYKLGGGLLGGGIATLLYSGFGLIATYAIIIIGLVICLILFTQKPLIKNIADSSQKAYQHAKKERNLRRENTSSIFTDIKLEKKSEPKLKMDAPLKKNKVPKDNKGVEVQVVDLEKTMVSEELPVIPDVFEGIPDIQIQRAESIATSELEDAQDISLESQVITPLDAQEQDSTEKGQTIPVKTSKNQRSSKKEIEDGIHSIETEIKNTETKVKPVYQFPPLNLLKCGSKSTGDSDQHLQATAKKLQQTLHSFGVNVTVTNVSCGPTVTRYELQPEQGVKVSRITNLADDIKLNLAAEDIRIEAPIPGKAAVGIEVPNANNSAVYLRDLLQAKAFSTHKSNLAFAAGKDIAGHPVITDIAKMPHLLIAGATGSGKSVCINTLIMSILYKANPDDVKLIMIDPKVVELSIYNGIPHLFIPVVTEPKKAAGALNWAVAEMNDRYNKFAQYNVRDLHSYNQKIKDIEDIEEENKPTKLPQIVIIVDELADLMMVAPGEVEDAICRLAQLARAAGIHLILATQRPSVNVITGLIKANMPSRIAFSVSSGVDSRTILDMNGAEKLLGKGDMLFYPQGFPKPARVQGAFVSDKEVQDVVTFLTEQSHSAGYNQEIVDKINSVSTAANNSSSPSNDLDAYFVDAGKFIIEKDKASIGMLQRVFKIGFNRAARMMDQLSEAGVVGEEEGTKPRKVLMSLEEFENYIEESL